MGDSKYPSDTNKALEDAFEHFLLAQKELLFALNAILLVCLDYIGRYEGTTRGDALQSLFQSVRSMIDLAIARLPESGVRKEQARLESFRVVQGVLTREMEPLRRKDYLNLEEQSRLAALQSIHEVFQKEIEKLKKKPTKKEETLRQVHIET